MYDRLGVTIIERGESFYQPLMPGIVKDLESKGERYIHCKAACCLSVSEVTLESNN